MCYVFCNVYLCTKLALRAKNWFFSISGHRPISETLIREIWKAEGLVYGKSAKFWIKLYLD